MDDQYDPQQANHPEHPTEATTEQRQRLLESIYRKNAYRLSQGRSGLDISYAYAIGLNRILERNLKRQTSPSDDGPTTFTGNIISMESYRG